MVCACIALAATAGLQAQVSREYDLKAVFLYNLASFVQWPESAFAGSEDPFVIGIVGVDPFGSVLEETVAREYVGRRRFEIHRFRRAGEIGPCHLLFISTSESRWLSEILAEIKGRPVLTVGDLPWFAESGGMVGFARVQDQLQLRVNTAAVEQAALSVSSKLLELSRVVGDSVADLP